MEHGRRTMTTRRDLLQTTAGALASLVFVGSGLTAASIARAQTRRREVVVNGKRVKTVDIHAHCAVPEALALMNAKLGGPGLRTDLDMATEVSARLKPGDEDSYQALEGLRGVCELKAVIGNTRMAAIGLTRPFVERAQHRFQVLNIIAAQPGGFLPSQAGRPVHGCPTGPCVCPGRT